MERDRRRTAPPCAEINITPLIDVLLVLLVIFMLVAPAARHGLDLGLPREARADEPPPIAPLVVSVSAESLSLNGQPLSDAADLGRRLRDTLAGRGDATVFVQPAAGLAYSRVVEVVDAAHGAGAARVGLLGVRR